MLTILNKHYYENPHNPEDRTILIESYKHPTENIYLFSVMFEKLYFFEKPIQSEWKTKDIENFQSDIALDEVFYTTKSLENANEIIKEMKAYYPDFDFSICLLSSSNNIYSLTLIQ